ncbi:CBP3-like protein [Diaporthe eres]|nr:CBP3-like protein [Diaporthe eres]
MADRLCRPWPRPGTTSAPDVDLSISITLVAAVQVARNSLATFSKRCPAAEGNPAVHEIYGGTEAIYKACAAPAAYTISEELRKKEAVPMNEDGEIGIGGGVWHDGITTRTSSTSLTARPDLAPSPPSAPGRK